MSLHDRMDAMLDARAKMESERHRIEEMIQEQTGADRVSVDRVHDSLVRAELKFHLEDNDTEPGYVIGDGDDE